MNTPNYLLRIIYDINNKYKDLEVYFMDVRLLKFNEICIDLIFHFRCQVYLLFLVNVFHLFTI